MTEGRRGVGAWWLPWMAACLLLAGTGAAFAVARATGNLDPCLPPLDGSVSISRACRREPAVQVFRALVIPAAPLMAAGWLLFAAWLRRAGAGRRLARAVGALGVLGALFLVLYATYLGTDGPTYRLMRRYGVYVFFAGTGFAHIFAAFGMPAGPTRPWMRAVASLLLAAGPIQMLADHLMEDDDRVANLFEWWIGIGFVVSLALQGRVLRAAGARLRLGWAS